mmetsp:Transcript_56208/g.182417  ORF Transcript_56208/g.182417 Transcript_56208/m.182417 type:complete len:215 (+) Transcript_56208:1929-2573(+)
MLGSRMGPEPRGGACGSKSFRMGASGAMSSRMKSAPPMGTRIRPLEPFLPATVKSVTPVFMMRARSLRNFSSKLKFSSSPVPGGVHARLTVLPVDTSVAYSCRERLPYSELLKYSTCEPSGKKVGLPMLEPPGRGSLAICSKLSGFCSRFGFPSAITTDDAAPPAAAAAAMPAAQAMAPLEENLELPNPGPDGCLSPPAAAPKCPKMAWRRSRG